MKLPNVEDARVDRTKIVDYLLALEHQEGAAKAAFFLRFGFTASDWQTFADALISHARVCPVTKLSESRFGTKYQIDGPAIVKIGSPPGGQATRKADEQELIPTASAAQA